MEGVDALGEIEKRGFAILKVVQSIVDGLTGEIGPRVRRVVAKGFRFESAKLPKHPNLGALLAKENPPRSGLAICKSVPPPPSQQPQPLRREW